jgi:hypothetical protein
MAMQKLALEPLNLVSFARRGTFNTKPAQEKLFEKGRCGHPLTR